MPESILRALDRNSFQGDQRARRWLVAGLLLLCVVGAVFTSWPLDAQDQRTLRVEDFARKWRWRLYGEETFNHEVTTLAHDSDGWIYVGTIAGTVYRYDGFLWSRISRGDVAEVVDPIRRIVDSGEKSNKRVYVVTDRGFWKIQGGVDLAMVRPGPVFRIAASHDGGVFLLERDGQVVKVEKDGKPRNVPEAGIKSIMRAGGEPNDYVIDGDRVHWLATSLGLRWRDETEVLRWREDSKLDLRLRDLPCSRLFLVERKWVHRDPNDPPIDVVQTSDEVWARFEGPGGPVLARRVGESDRGWTWQTVNFDGGTPEVVDLLRDGSGNYYAMDGAGRGFFSADGNSWIPVERDNWEVVVDGLHSGVLDQAGNVWYVFKKTRGGGGVARFDPLSDRWSTVPFADGKDRRILSLLHAGDGTVWAGTQDGVYRAEDGQSFSPVHPSLGKDMVVANVTTLAEDDYGKVWVGSESSFTGAIFFERGSSITEHRDFDDRHIQRIVTGRHKNLWFLPAGPVPGKNIYRVYSLARGGRHAKPGMREIEFPGRISDFLETRRGELWYATSNGLVKSGRPGVTEVMTEEDGLLSSSIWEIVEDPNPSDASIWVTYDASGFGVSRIRPDKRVEHFDERHGLGKARIWSIAATGWDYEYNIWIGTNAGISRFDTECWYHHSVQGLDLVETVVPSGTKDEDPRKYMYLGTYNSGVHRFRLDDHRRPRFTQELEQEQHVDHDGAVVHAFSWDARDFKDQTRSDRLLFRHRLDDQPWSLFTSAREVEKRNLSPGTHKFQVEARDLDGSDARHSQVRAFPVEHPSLLPAWVFWPLVLGGVAFALLFFFALFCLVSRSRDPLRRVSQAFEESSEAAFVLDREGNVVYFNPASVEALGLGDLGRRLRGLPVHAVPALWGSDVGSLVRSVLGGHGLRAGVEDWEDERGRVLRMRVVPVFSDARRDRPRGALLLVDDCTSTARVRAAQRRRRRMGAVRDLADRLHVELDELLDAMTSDSVSPRLERSSGRLGELAGVLKEFSSYGREGKATDVNTSSLLEELVNLSSNGGGVVPPGIRVDYRSQPGLWNVNIEPEAVSRALEEVLRNCVDAMPEGGQIVVRSANQQIEEAEAELAPGRYVELTIRDSGPGMDPLQLERAFDPLFTTKTRGRHRGLGLSLAYGVLRRQGGGIVLESNPGRGTTAHIFLPVKGQFGV